MRSIVLKFGGYGVATMTIIFGVQWTFLIRGEGVNFAAQEVVGYTGMVLALSFVYFGIRQYRDAVNGGYLTFGQGLKIGLLITLIPAVAFGIADTLYVLFIDPGFMDRYYDAMVVQMKATLPAAEFEVKYKAMEAEKELFKNPLIQFTIMAMTVFLIGVIITALSALFLQKRKPAAV